MNTEENKDALFQQEFPEILGDPKINIPHSDATMDAHDAVKGEMVSDHNNDQIPPLLG